jgi:RHS repeat-associated protein
LDQTFAYDNLNRLSAHTLAATSYTYSYDATGNRTAKTIGGSTYTTTVSVTSNRLDAAQSPAGTASYSYDAMGNVVGDGGTTFTYSDRGRMATAVTAGGTVSYTYNGFGQRARKTGPGAVVPSGTRYYVYDEAGRMLGEYRNTGRPEYETIYLGDMPVGLIKYGGTPEESTYNAILFNLYADHLDTPRMVTRQTHVIVWRWDTGEAFGASPPDANPGGLSTFVYHQRFPGQTFDQEAGLVQNWHREYDPMGGRYRQSDPIGLAGGINTYLYVERNPLGLTDPSGLDPMSDRVAGIPPGRTGDQYSSRYSKCMHDYLVSNYGTFVTDTLVPGFSVFSYIPGSGYTTDAWVTTVKSGAAKGAVGYGVYKAGSAMASSGTGATATVGGWMTTAAPILAKGVVVLGTGVTAFATTAQLMAINACSCER